MREPAFAGMQFRHWARTLVGQINRNHYLFVVRGKQVVGFVGWALTNEQSAEAWLAGRIDVPSDQAADGDCMIVNAFQANSREVTAFLYAQLRSAKRKPRMLYGKRYYSDGHWRPVRLRMQGNGATSDSLCLKRSPQFPIA